MDAWIPAITIKAALAGFERLGFSKEKLLKQRLTQEQLNDPYGAVPDEIFGQIWMEAFKLNYDPTLATKAALAVPFGEFGLLDHLVNTAKTLGEGLHMLNLFLWLVSTGLRLEFEHGDADWVWVLMEEAEDPISTQWTLALMLSRMQSRVVDFAIDEVQLSQIERQSEDRLAFEALWKAPVHLGQARTGFRLSTGVWQMRNRQATPELKETLQGLAERVDIKQFTLAPLTYAIKARLPEALQEQAFNAEDIAKALNLSKRTLQRKLAHENISFKELLDSYRQERALAMLALRSQSIASVAYALGYEEQSSFNRAFRRWTGVSPKAWLASSSQ